MKITEALIAEHIVLNRVFDQVERSLAPAATLAVVKSLAAVVEGLLHQHASAEVEFAYGALDHALAEDGRLEVFYREHRESDARLKEIHTAKTLTGARAMLVEALAGAREHFRREEKELFPLLEGRFQDQQLAELAEGWRERYGLPPSGAAKLSDGAATTELAAACG